MDSFNNNSDIKNEKSCNHFIRIESLCVMCGHDVSSDVKLVPVAHNSDKILQTEKSAKKEQKIKNKKLFEDKKLILILDLDQTILHTTHSPSNCDFIFKLEGTYHYVKFRPFLEIFLEKAVKLFEIHVYTMGIREYAKIICERIDPYKKYFGDRIVSRSENFNEFKKSISRITCISNNVLILDDRPDVWDYNKNLVVIRPFWYHDKIDINDPIKLKKNEDLIEITALDLESEKLIKTENKFEKIVDEDKINKINMKVTDNLLDVPQNNSFENKNINNLNEDDKILVASVNKNNFNNNEELNNNIDDINKKEGNENIQSNISHMNNNKIENKIVKKFFDNELLYVFDYFEKIHKKFYKKYSSGKKNINVKRFLKFKFLKSIRIVGNAIYYPLLKFTGCIIDYENPGFAICDDNIAKIKKIPNLNVNWIFECIFQRKLVDYRYFIINDYSYEDEYLKELEDEFF